MRSASAANYGEIATPYGKNNRDHEWSDKVQKHMASCKCFIMSSAK